MRSDKEEYEIIADVLVAVVNGPFCVDGEFRTITGVSLAEVEDVLKDWPAIPPERERLVVWTVERCLWAMLTYPNPLREEAWPFWMDVSPKRVESLMRKWCRRRDRIGSPWGST